MARNHLLNVLLLLSLCLPFAAGQRKDPCYVCRTAERFVTNRGKSFTLTDIYGKQFSMTCGELEDTGKNELTVSNSVCGIFLAHAEKNCDCGGPPIAPVGVLNENPACDICKDGRKVPFIKEEELVNTGVAGEMPCGFLYETAANGFMPGHLCPVIQQNVADFCCTIPAINPVDLEPEPPMASPTTEAPTFAPHPSCRGIHEECGNDSPCCSAYACKVRKLGSPATCSVRSVRQRQSVANPNRGGSAGRAKYAN